MPGMLFSIRSGLDKLNFVVSAISALGILFASLSITWAVIGRRLFGMSTIWELEASVYILIYAAFLGLAYSDRAGSQIAIGVLREKLTGKARLIHRLALDVAVLILFILIFYSSVNFFWGAWTTGWKSMSLWGPPLWIPYLALPIGTFILIVNLVVDILIRLTGNEVPADKV